jgi:hypothetical protein
MPHILLKGFLITEKLHVILLTIRRQFTALNSSPAQFTDHRAQFTAKIKKFCLMNFRYMSARFR